MGNDFIKYRLSKAKKNSSAVPFLQIVHFLNETM